MRMSVIVRGKDEISAFPAIKQPLAWLDPSFKGEMLTHQGLEVKVLCSETRKASDVGKNAWWAKMVVIQGVVWNFCTKRV